MIQEIIIRNYGIFKGTHRLALSIDPSALVTVFSTGGGSGKTTLIDAIYWCLYGDHIVRGFSRKECPLLNHERSREMSEGETETVEVDLLFENDGETQKLTRSIVFVKESGKLRIRKTFDNRRDFTAFLPAREISPVLFLSDLGYGYHRSFHRTLDKILSVAPSGMLQYRIAKRVATAATAIFNEIYFRPGEYEIVCRADGFSLMRTDLNDMIECNLSQTDQIVFEVSILHGIRDVFCEECKELAEFPIFIDDIFNRCLQEQFCPDNLIQLLPGRQIILLAHEYNLRNQAVASQCGVSYTMWRARGGASVDIAQEPVA